MKRKILNIGMLALFVLAISVTLEAVQPKGPKKSKATTPRVENQVKKSKTKRSSGKRTGRRGYSRYEICDSTSYGYDYPACEDTVWIESAEGDSAVWYY